MPQNVIPPQNILVMPTTAAVGRNRSSRGASNRRVGNPVRSRAPRESAREPVFLGGALSEQENPFRNLTVFISQTGRTRTFRIPEARQPTQRVEEQVLIRRAIRTARFDIFERSRSLDAAIRTLYRNKLLLQDQLIRLNIAEAQSHFNVIG